MKNLTLLEKMAIGAVMLISLALMFGGCSYQPAINAAEKMAAQSIDAGNDNALDVNLFALCHLPYATILQHPKMWEWVNKACAPGVNEATPNTLLTK
jgi:hypothetical protein